MKLVKGRWYRQPVIYWIAGSYAAIIIALIVHALKQAGFGVEKSVNLVDVSSALLTLFLAFYIPNRIERVLATRRYEIDSLIGEVKHILAYFDTILLATQAASSPLEPEQATTILSAVENSGRALQLLDQLLVENELLDLSSFTDKIRLKRLQYKRLVTGSNFGSTDFSYEPYVLILINATYHELKGDCLRLIFQLNKS